MVDNKMKRGSRPKPPGSSGARPRLSTTLHAAEDLRLEAHLRSLREQIECNHSLLERLSAASLRLIRSLEAGDVYEAIAEIVANLVGSEEVAVFLHDPVSGELVPEWSTGLPAGSLPGIKSGAGLIGRAVQRGTTLVREHEASIPALPYEVNLSACVVLKSSREVVGAIAIFRLLPQKTRLEWADFQLLKFLEVYGAVGVQYQKLQGRRTRP